MASDLVSSISRIPHLKIRQIPRPAKPIGAPPNGLAWISIFQRVMTLRRLQMARVIWLVQARTLYTSTRVDWYIPRHFSNVFPVFSFVDQFNPSSAWLLLSNSQPFCLSAADIGDLWRPHQLSELSWAHQFPGRPLGKSLTDLLKPSDRCVMASSLLTLDSLIQFHDNAVQERQTLLLLCIVRHKSENEILKKKKTVSYPWVRNALKLQLVLTVSPLCAGVDRRQPNLPARVVFFSKIKKKNPTELLIWLWGRSHRSRKG